jgi:hypothetical protein
MSPAEPRRRPGKALRSADIESPPRMNEVKAFGKSNRGNDLWLETRQV